MLKEQTQHQLGHPGLSLSGLLSQRYVEPTDARLNRARLAALLFCSPITGHDVWGLFKTTPIQFLQKEANLPDAAGLLDIRRLEMVLRCLGQVEGHPSRGILPPTFRFGEIGEGGELFSEMNMEWATKAKGGDIGKRLARALNRAIPVTLESGIDYYYEWEKPDKFPGKIKIFEKE